MVDVFADRVFGFQTVAVRSLIMHWMIAVAAVEQVFVGVLFVRLAQNWRVTRFVDSLAGF